MLNFDDVGRYRKCMKKQYEIWCSKVPVGTVVINKLEQAQAYRQVGRKSLIPPVQAAKLCKMNPAMYGGLMNNGLVQVTSEHNCNVMSGTCGEMWIVSDDKLVKTYMTPDGQQFTEPYMLSKAYQGVFDDTGSCVVAYNTKKVTKSDYAKIGVIPWFRVKTKGSVGMQYMAMHVPSTQHGIIVTGWGARLAVNGPGVGHGKGDFIVCPMLPNGQPDLRDRWVVNGMVFADTYDNRGWEKELGANYGNGGTVKMPDFPFKQIPSEAGQLAHSGEFGVRY